MGSLLARLFLKSNDPHCNLFTGRKENGDWRRSPQKIFGATPFESRGNAPFDIKRTMQKGQFCPFH